MNNIVLRDYQEEAKNAIIDNDWNGILEMGTGTGKTLTSLMIADEYSKQNDRLFLIVIAPYKHLISQWIENCQMFKFDKYIECYDSTFKWRNELISAIRNYNNKVLDKVVVIVTYKTAASIDKFQKPISKVDGTKMLLADECHNYTYSSFRANLFGDYKRIGLSATPDRWWDDHGTSFINKEFYGKVYEYPLERAIKEGNLTEYRYEPLLVDMTMEEREKYAALTKMIAEEMQKQKSEQDEELIQVLNRKRALIISKCQEKIEILIRELKKKDVETSKHIVVYCAQKQVTEICKIVSDLGFRTRRFDSTIPNKERQKILKSFADGWIQVIVAIKCLDEGVDIPATREAYFMASTSNPREFVQRRGRILRKHEGKREAIIHDFIVMPNCEIEDKDFFESVICKELPRFAEFSRFAKNEFEARSIVKERLEPFDLEYLMNKLPWDVYKEMKELEGNYEQY